MTLCKECGESFSSDRSLHAHLKTHGLSVASYYCKHFPRKDLFSGQPIPFKNKDEYFSTYFLRRENLTKWLAKTPKDKKSSIILDMLEHRIKSKNLSAAPNELELFFAGLPLISDYKECFGSYSAAANACGVDVMLKSKLPPEWNQDFSRRKIFTDSREQRPLQFANSECVKLDTGDYAVSGEDFAHTFVDRKSFEDWCGTLVGDNLSRFEREVQRCKSQDSFLWVVVESPLESVFRTAELSYHKPNLSYISHNMRVLQHKYSSNLQFVFSGGREQSQKIIPKLLCLGKRCWGVDLQFWLKETTNTTF